MLSVTIGQGLQVWSYNHHNLNLRVYISEISPMVHKLLKCLENASLIDKSGIDSKTICIAIQLSDITNIDYA